MTQPDVDPASDAEPHRDIRRRGRRVAPLAVSGLAATLVVGGALAVPVLLKSDKDAGAARATLAAAQKFDLGSPRHVRGKIAYAQTPPVGGDHNRAWLACGRYDEPVPNENAVHDLEHGTVWITYRPDMAAADVALLAESLPKEGIMSPYDDLPAPAVVTVWGVQLKLTGVDDKRLALFLAEYGDGGSAPEFEASCAGGIGDPIDDAVPV
jgi:Protein of unknown function (DUF3105)